MVELAVATRKMPFRYSEPCGMAFDALDAAISAIGLSFCRGQVPLRSPCLTIFIFRYFAVSTGGAGSSMGFSSASWGNIGR